MNEFKELMPIPSLALVAAAVGAIVWMNGNYMTIREKDLIEKRLDRIETKLDKVLTSFIKED